MAADWHRSRRAIVEVATSPLNAIHNRNVSREIAPVQRIVTGYALVTLPSSGRLRKLIMFLHQTPVARVLFWIVITTAGSVGCEHKAVETLFPVTGRITLDGQPLPRGSLTLRPELAENNWHQPTGMIGDEGHFIVYTNGREGVPPGTYRVVVFVTEATSTENGAARPGMPRSLVPQRYNNPDETPLRVQVVAQSSDKTYDLELTTNDK